ncbi:hypothetical protein J8273_8456 [Carpediemonas membranifera]|uniref:Reverse transcriptase domain-containing protein n=1 Tax=Carpediemonas membranifera TaxID=201153 RepID=A0A8J6AXM3_9EUKA|nr:hypothetical protein J8273_8456 [Carpediemonas membranifera]|eukprot:KAG9389779.1 hypothetical protein J8273_8456 [Carpediemonas membranifera]
MFVDDTAVTGETPEKSKIVANLVIEVIKEHLMRANAQKSEMISVDRAAVARVGGVTLMAKEEAKYLGLWIASGKDPLAACIRKKREQSERYKKLVRRVGWTRGNMPALASRLLLEVYIWPRIMFGVEVWGYAAGGNKIWTDWQGIMAGTGPGGGSVMRILNGWMDLQAHLEMLAVKRIVTSRGQDLPIRDRVWKEGSIMWKARDSVNALLRGTREGATNAGKIDFGREMVRMNWTRRCKSKTAVGLMEVLGPKRMGKCMAGKPAISRKTGKWQSRAEWKRIVSVAANVSPSPSSAERGEGPERALADLAMGEELKHKIQRRCPCAQRRAR